jgi:mono/diheme cytochrome c family protein
MGSQPKAKPFQESQFFADGTSARPLVTGTVPRGDLELDPLLYEGLVNGKPSLSFPETFPTRGDSLRRALERGRDQYTVYCAMCHGDSGDGHGIVVQRGFVPPPSYHLDRLRVSPPGHIFDVITNGYGAMYSYGDRIIPADRWNIVAYVRVLQMTSGTPADQLDSAQRKRLENMQ